MWKFISPCAAILGVFFMGIFESGSMSLVGTIAVGGLWIIIFSYACAFVLEKINKDIGIILYMAGALYGYAHAPVQHSAQAAMLTIITVIFWMDIVSTYMGRGYTTKPTT